MIATMPEKETRGINTNHRKEDHFSEEIVAFTIEQGNARPIVTARIYSTDSRSYACLWVNGKDTWATGSGFAGGYGYHRPSAALQSAISNAGIHLDEDIDGRGHGSMEDAARAIATAAYPGAPVYIHNAHA